MQRPGSSGAARVLSDNYNTRRRANLKLRFTADFRLIFRKTRYLNTRMWSSRGYCRLAGHSAPEVRLVEKKITAVLLKHFPGARAVWLFGSFGTEYERRDSDVDIGLLLPERAGILEAVKESGRVLQ